MKCVYLDISNPELTVPVTEDTQYVLNIQDVDFSQKHSVIFEFREPGVSAQIIGAYVAREGRNVDLYTEAAHYAVSTSCTTDIRGVLLDGGRSTYIGKIKIAKTAQQTSSFLDDGVLVVGKGTHNRSDPMLEIEANDVRASHGATTGRIDAQQLYYLQSRGLSVNEAEKVLIKAYLDAVVLDIIDEEVKETLSKKLTQDV